MSTFLIGISLFLVEFVIVLGLVYYVVSSLLWFMCWFYEWMLYLGIGIDILNYCITLGQSLLFISFIVVFILILLIVFISSFLNDCTYLILSLVVMIARVLRVGHL